MSWPESVARVNNAKFAMFGVQVTYYSNHGEGDPVTLTALRVKRSPDEYNPTGAFEGIEVKESDFNDPPVAGDVFTLAGTDYVVAEPPRNPDPAGGTLTLILNRRTAPNA
jgi:hypothetical protein